jgi:hypothetical protein
MEQTFLIPIEIYLFIYERLQNEDVFHLCFMKASLIYLLTQMSNVIQSAKKQCSGMNLVCRINQKVFLIF